MKSGEGKASVESSGSGFDLALLHWNALPEDSSFGLLGKTAGDGYGSGEALEFFSARPEEAYGA